MSTPRFNARAIAPEVDATLIALNGAAARNAASVGLSALLIELVQIRASQINGCAFCLRAHVRNAIKAGESADRLGVVAAWRDTGYFDETERAALELVEAVTLLPNGQVPDDVYSRVTATLSEQEYAAVVWLGIAINAFNRAIAPAHVDVS